MSLKSIYIIVMSFFVTVGSYAQNDITWDFPIKPGTEEWKDLKTTEDKIRIFQIPSDIIETISTKQLVQLCLNYPLIGDILFSNTGYQDSFDFISESFNGFQELFKREDAATELLNAYENFDLNDFNKNKREVYKNVFYDICFDIVISQSIFINALNKEQTTRLLRCTLEKLNTRKQNGDSIFRKKFTTAVLSRLLVKDSMNEERLSSIKGDGFLILNSQFFLTDSLILDNIEKDAQNYLQLLND